MEVFSCRNAQTVCCGINTIELGYFRVAVWLRHGERAPEVRRVVAVVYKGLFKYDDRWKTIFSRPYPGTTDSGRHKQLGSRGKIKKSTGAIGARASVDRQVGCRLRVPEGGRKAHLM